jgi:predicted peptidase
MCLHGPDAELENNPNESFKNSFQSLILSPQCPAGLGKWEDAAIKKAVLQMLDEVSKSMNVDKKRVYVTGLNEGGAGAWQLAMEAPDRFAAMAPLIVSGSYNPPNNAGDVLKNVPTWAVIGEGERASADAMNNAFKVYKADWKLSPVGKLTLEEMSQGYRNPALYEWLLKHKKGS